MAEEIEEEAPKEEEEKEEEKEEEDEAKEEEEGKDEDKDKEEEEEEGDKEEEAEEKADEGEEEKKEEPKKETKEEKAARLAEEKQKKKEEADAKKAKAEEEKQRKKEEAEAKKQQKKEEAEARKEAKRKEKEEKAKLQTRKPKSVVKSLTMIGGVVPLLLLALGSLGFASYTMDRALKIEDKLNEDIETYCRDRGEPATCLTIPQVAIVPFLVFLIWAVLLTMTSIFGLHGALRETTGSITTFVSGNVVLSLLEIAISTLIIVISYELKDSTSDECNSALTQELANNSTMPLQSQPSGCETLLDPMRESVILLWRRGSPWAKELGCENSNSVEEMLDCLSSLFTDMSIVVSCLMSIPILFQIIGCIFALKLREWVIEEQGMQLFAMCRASYGARVGVMLTVLFIVLFGGIVAAFVPTQ